jgi:hypothetical protein
MKGVAPRALAIDVCHCSHTPAGNRPTCVPNGLSCSAILHGGHGVGSGQTTSAWKHRFRTNLVAAESVVSSRVASAHLMSLLYTRQSVGGSGEHVPRRY